MSLPLALCPETTRTRPDWLVHRQAILEKTTQPLFEYRDSKTAPPQSCPTEHSPKDPPGESSAEPCSVEAVTFRKVCI